jgi:hypothetical protein
MACKHWNDEWVAHLYGELDPGAERAMTAHLEGCEACRATIEGLERSRRMLAGAAPEVPSAPRVIVLRPRPIWSRAWAFAAGAACALLMFGAGFVSSTQLPGAGRTEPPATAREASAGGGESQPATAEQAAEVAALRDELAALHRRLDGLEQTPASSDGVTAAQFREGIDGLERRLNEERVHDLEYVMRSLTASELRTGSWMDKTHEALTMLAMRQDGRFAEQ